MRTSMTVAALAAGFASAALTVDAQQAVRTRLDGRPDAVIDLRTDAGVDLVAGRWRYADARLVQVPFNAPGPDLKPSGPPTTTWEYEPKADAADVDGSGWRTIAPAALEERRGAGKLSFGWYRFSFTVPERAGGIEMRGATVIFETVVDDYAEVIVNGRLPRVLGQAGGAVVKGFNAPNRVVLTRDARPGERFQIAIFGANAPLSDLPSNFIWVRSATLDVYARTPDAAPSSSGRVMRLHPDLDAIVPPSPVIEKVAEGFQFTEGPVWVPDGYLLFSDPNDNTIYRWSEDDGVSVFRVKSGYAGVDIGRYKQSGSNGLALDGDGRVTINQHGNRRVVRLEKNGQLTVLADRYEGRRFNSPNDLVYKSDGALYFTDPPFGLPRVFDDPAKELPFSGVFRWKDGHLDLLTRELTGPNGLAFSPDERFLYVGNWDPQRKVVMRYDVRADGTLASATVFADLTDRPGEDAIDGVKVDRAGNVFVSGPGGLWIFSPEGRHLGTIESDEHAHNMAWGDGDGRTLYLTARTGVYRIRLLTGGLPFAGRTN